MKKSFILLTFLMLSCSPEHEIRFAAGNKPTQNTFTVKDSSGKTYQLQLNADITPEQLIALQTALSNTLILEAGAIRQHNETTRHRDTISIFWGVLIALCFCVGAVAAVMVVSIRRG